MEYRTDQIGINFLSIKEMTINQSSIAHKLTGYSVIWPHHVSSICHDSFTNFKWMLTKSCTFSFFLKMKILWVKKEMNSYTPNIKFDRKGKKWILVKSLIPNKGLKKHQRFRKDVVLASRGQVGLRVSTKILITFTRNVN